MADVDWPTGVDVHRWMISNAFGSDGDDLSTLDDVTAVATDIITSKVDSTLMPVDPTKCPAGVAYAIKVRAASLYMRRTAVNGVISVSDDSVIRVGRYDADVEAAIAPYLAALVG